MDADNACTYRRYLVDSRRPGLSEALVGNRIDLRFMIFDLRFFPCNPRNLWFHNRILIHFFKMLHPGSLSCLHGLVRMEHFVL